MCDPAPPEIIELGRIRLRQPELSDAGVMFECGNDPEVARYADWPVGTAIGPVIERIKRSRENWESGSDYRWIISLPAGNRAIGAISCSVEGHSAEFGFLIDRLHWGKGHATGAARAVARWAISQPSIWRVWATCDVENLASARVLEKAGLTREGTLRRSIVRPNISGDPRDAFIYSLVK